MFNKDFYPTPTSVIEKMLVASDIQGKIILEPSAGSGNIVSFLQNNGALEVLACETNKDLSKIVSSKCRLIEDDFLDVRSEDISHIDMIIMNPPFSADDKHLLHAWEIAPGGCEIVSLCNYQTMSNNWTESRKELMETVSLNGRFDDFGECFTSAERKTNVRVACVYLYKPKTGDNEFEDFFSLDEEVGQTEEGIVQYNYIRDIVSRYTQAVSMFDDVMNASKAINELTKPIYNGTYRGIMFGAKQTDRDERHVEITRDVFKKDLQKLCWTRVFNDMNMGKYMTKGVRENINAFVERQIHVPFTMKNVYKMAEMIVGTHGSRMNQVLIEAFDLICSYSAENSTAGEKWKTNSDYMVNKKFIVPYICEYDTRWPSSHVKIGYGRNRSEIEDIVRALCHLTATNYDDVRELDSFVGNPYNMEYDRLRSSLGLEWGKWHDWKPFFKIRGYKKGTMHFEFLDDHVWMKFNIEVAKAKGWQLPKTRKTKTSNTQKATPCDQ